MNKNIHIVNAEKISAQMPLATNPSNKNKLIKQWANEMRLACRFAAKRGF